MAMYHFRIKTDKKPDGTKISAVQHVDYIRREGNYAEEKEWEEKNKFVGNCISAAGNKNGSEDLKCLLYKTAKFGSIRKTEEGIEVTEKATPTTIAVALMLADETMNHKPLIISGTTNFKKSIMDAAEKFNLEIKFEDRLMEIEIKRRRAKRGKEEKNAEQISLVKATAEEILKKLEEEKTTVNAETHVEYIYREKAYERRGGCIFHSHHLPKWAKDDPKKFFKAAEKYEGVGNRRYVEIEFALPNELKTVEQYRQIIDAFIEKHLANHYYAYAIHEKKGMLSEEQRHPHVHIMFSERLIDEVEKKKERAAQDFFKYPARKKKDGSEPTFEEKYRRGSPRDRKWCNRQYVCQMREDLAKIENEVLKKNGFSIRVDHRTLKAQKEAAEKKGDTSLAQLFNRMAEEYIGVVSCKDSDDPKLARLKNFRSLRNRHFDSVLRKDSVEKEIEELETKDSVQKVQMKAREYITSEEFLAQKFDMPQLQELKEKVKYEIREVNHWKRAIISQHDAEEKARLEYMTPSEREIWQKYFEMLNQKKQLAKFVEEHTNPDSKDGKMEEVLEGAKGQIFAILSSAAILKPSIKEIKKKLETPDCRKNILLVTHQILQANSLARKILKMESEKLDRAVDELKAEIFYQSISDKEYYKTREIYNILRRQYFELKKEYEKQLEVRYSYQKKVISTSRAMEMAKNIFVKGDFKKLRASLRKLQKDREKFAKNLEVFHQHEEKLQSTKITADNQAELWQEKYLLTKEKMSLEIEKNALTI